LGVGRESKSRSGNVARKNAKQPGGPEQKSGSFKRVPEYGATGDPRKGLKESKVLTATKKGVKGKLKTWSTRKDNEERSHEAL